MYLKIMLLLSIMNMAIEFILGEVIIVKCYKIPPVKAFMHVDKQQHFLKFFEISSVRKTMFLQTNISFW